MALLFLFLQEIHMDNFKNIDKKLRSFQRMCYFKVLMKIVLFYILGILNCDFNNLIQFINICQNYTSNHISVGFLFN